MRQRPSWLNYASADVASNRELWCNRKVKFTKDVTKDVTKDGNAIFKVEPPFPTFGSDFPAVFIGFCAQVVSAMADPRGHTLFHVSGGAGGYCVSVRRIDAEQTQRGYDSRTLAEGDIFSAIIIRPGTYSVTNDPPVAAR